MYLRTRYGFRCRLVRVTLRDDYFGKEVVLQQIAAHQRNDEDASDNRSDHHLSRIVIRRITHRCHGGPRLPGHGRAVALLAALLVPALLWACLLIAALLVAALLVATLLLVSALLRLCLLVSALLVATLLIAALLVATLLVAALLIATLLRLCLLVSALLVAALLLVSAHRLARIRLAIVGRELGTHDGLSGR